MSSLGDLFITVGANISGFRSAMSDVSSSLDRTTAKMQTAGAALTAAFTVPLVGVGIAALKTAGDLEQNAIAFKTLLGSSDAAQKHLQDLRDFAAKTPFQFTELVTASKRMQALGFEAKEVLPALRNIGDAAAALGMGAEGIQRITTALGQMKAKGAVQAEEMRQLAEAGIPAWQILAKVLNTDVAGAMKLVEKRAVDSGTAVPAILAGINERFGGLMDQQAKTMMGQWSNIKDQITFTLTDVGTALMPVAKNMMEGVLNPALMKVKELAKAFGELSTPMQNAVLGVAAFMAALGPLTFVGAKTLAFFSSMATLSSKLGVVIASLGSRELGLLAGSFGNVGAAYTTMLATGILRIAGWVGLAYAIMEVVSAARNLENEQEKLAAATRTQEQGLAKLEKTMKQQGIDFSDAQKAYRLGWITLNDYLGTLAKMESAYIKLHPPQQKATIAAHEAAGAAKNAAAAWAAWLETLGEAYSTLGFSALNIKELNSAMNVVDASFRRGEMSLYAYTLASRGFDEALKRNKLSLAEFYESARKVSGGVASSPLLSAFGTALGNTSAMPELMPLSGPTLDELRNLPKKYDVVRESIAALYAPTIAWANSLGLATDNARIVADAGAYFGERTTAELEDAARAAEENYRAMAESGEYSAAAVQRAWVTSMRKQVEAQKAAGKITVEEYAKITAELDGMSEQSTKKRIRYEWSAADEMSRSMEGAFQSTYRALARSTLAWKDWGKNLKNIALDLAEDMLSTMLRAFFKPLEDEAVKLAGSIGKTLGGIWGKGASGAAQTAGSVGGTAGGAAGSIGGAVSGGASGVMGIIGAVGSAVSAVSGVISNFQQAGMNKSLDVLVNHTLRQFNITMEIKDALWQQHYGVIAKIDMVFNRLGDMWGTLREGGSGQTIIFNFYGGDLEAFKRELKLQGIKPA